MHRLVIGNVVDGVRIHRKRKQDVRAEHEEKHLLKSVSLQDTNYYKENAMQRGFSVRA